MSWEEELCVGSGAQACYYKPINLEKEGTRVKQKEFIQRIGDAQAAAHVAHQRSGAARGHIFLCAARLGSPRPGLAAAHKKPLPPLYRIRCALAAARGFAAPGSRAQSGRPRSRA